MELNIQKYYTVTFSKNEIRYTFDYSIQRTNIDRSDIVRDQDIIRSIL